MKCLSWTNSVCLALIFKCGKSVPCSVCGEVSASSWAAGSVLPQGCGLCSAWQIVFPAPHPMTESFMNIAKPLVPLPLDPQCQFSSASLFPVSDVRLCRLSWISQSVLFLALSCLPWLQLPNFACCPQIRCQEQPPHFPHANSFHCPDPGQQRVHRALHQQHLHTQGALGGVPGELWGRALLFPYLL